MSISFDSSAQILVGICSSHAHPERRQACRDTWLKNSAEDVSSLFFVGLNDGQSSPMKEQDTLELEAPDTYHELPEKVLNFFQWALDHSNFQWLFKCDDDTYLNLHRLKTLPDPSYDLIGDDSVRTRGAPSGGAGYLLSRSTAERLCQDDSLKLTGPEDIIIGKAVNGYGLTSHATERLCLSSYPFPTPDNDMISAHWCSPERMRIIHDLNAGAEVEELKATHPHWTDSILLLPDGRFTRRSSSCSGRWKKLPEGRVYLEWFDWGHEVLVPNKSSRVRDKILSYQCVPASEAS